VKKYLGPLNDVYYRCRETDTLLQPKDCRDKIWPDCTDAAVMAKCYHPAYKRDVRLAFERGVITFIADNIECSEKCHTTAELVYSGENDEGKKNYTGYTFKFSRINPGLVRCTCDQAGLVCNIPDTDIAIGGMVGILLQMTTENTAQKIYAADVTLLGSGQKFSVDSNGTKVSFKPGKEGLIASLAKGDVEIPSYYGATYVIPPEGQTDCTQKFPKNSRKTYCDKNYNNADRKVVLVRDVDLQACQADKAVPDYKCSDTPYRIVVKAGNEELGVLVDSRTFIVNSVGKTSPAELNDVADLYLSSEPVNPALKPSK
jgi:hypothetical protein